MKSLAAYGQTAYTITEPKNKKQKTEESKDVGDDEEREDDDGTPNSATHYWTPFWLTDVTSVLIQMREPGQKWPR